MHVGGTTVRPMYSHGVLDSRCAAMLPGVQRDDTPCMLDPQERQQLSRMTSRMRRSIPSWMHIPALGLPQSDSEDALLPAGAAGVGYSDQLPLVPSAADVASLAASAAEAGGGGDGGEEEPAAAKGGRAVDAEVVAAARGGAAGEQPPTPGIAPIPGLLRPSASSPSSFPVAEWGEEGEGCSALRAAARRLQHGEHAQAAPFFTTQTAGWQLYGTDNDDAGALFEGPTEAWKDIAVLGSLTSNALGLDVIAP